MKRRQESGFEHRKAAEAKRRKEEELLRKVPKISSFFGESSKSSSASVASFEVNETETNQYNVESTASQSESEHEHYAFVDDVPDDEPDDEFDTETSTAQSQILFETDAALWSIDENMNALQSYWAKKGIDFCSFHVYLNFL